MTMWLTVYSGSLCKPLHSDPKQSFKRKMTSGQG